MRLGKRAYSLLVFLGVAVLGGVLAAGFLVPVVSMATATGRDAASSLNSLPADLATPRPSERSRVEMADGSLLTYFYDENRVYEPLANISAIMQDAQVAIEDHRFFEHGAIDLKGTMRALVSTSQGVTQGGSSITQQYVRLVLLETAEANNDDEAKAAATENTVARKIRELRFAMALEARMSKEEILEGYLNLSYYGDGAYGVEAAAKHYFGVSAEDLDLPQSAMLAGLVRNPVTTNPVNYPQVALERRNHVIDRMVELGNVTKEEGEAAKAVPFDQSKVTQHRLDCGNARYPFICDYAKRVLLSDQFPDLGSTAEERKNRLFRGGLTVRLTVDPKIQKQSEKTIADFIDARDPVVGVITMLEPSTGRIVSMAQSRPTMGDNKDGKKDKWRGETYYNYAVRHDMGGSDGFQGGSTFKAFIAAAALDNKMGAEGKFNAKQQIKLTGPFKSCDGDFMLTKPWTVNNAGGTGIRDMYSGVTKSVNTYFAQLIQAVGGCESVKMADKLGLELGKPTKEHPDVLSYDSTPAITLGSMDITPLSMVEAYATFANRGKHCEPVIISSIKTREGVQLEVPHDECEQVISKDVADAINKIFQGPFRNGTAAPARIPGVAQIAGKTGTVSDNRSVWTVGYTPELAAAGMYSYDKDPRFAKYWTARGGNYLRGAYLKYSKQRVQGVSGREAGAKLLKPAMQYALKSYDMSARFKEPPASILKGEWNSVPSCKGMGVGTCKSKLRKAGFTYFEDEVSSDAAKGTIVGTSPSGKAPKLSAIAIQISKGPKKGSEGWCKLDGNGHKAECVKYLPPPSCGPGEVLVPNPPPGVCMPQQPSPSPQPGGPGRGNAGG